MICMTDNEAEGFANFMYEFLRQMERWRSNTALFKKEFGSLPGALEEPYTMGSTALVTHGNFLKVMAKWSNVIARLLKECLQPPVSNPSGDTIASTIFRKTCPAVPFFKIFRFEDDLLCFKNGLRILKCGCCYVGQMHRP